ncbi:MAG: class II aldolase/adducin family protein, partial [Thermodesulfobacteriota bacterium]
MHLALYRSQPLARAIVHTHPLHLLALDLAGQGSPLDLPLFEAGLFRELFTEVEPIRPGSSQLARAVAEAAREHRAIYLRRHGLVCWEENLTRALALSEELEALAKVKLKGGI